MLAASDALGGLKQPSASHASFAISHSLHRSAVLPPRGVAMPTVFLAKNAELCPYPRLGAARKRPGRNLSLCFCTARARILELRTRLAAQILSCLADGLHHL